SFDVNRDVGHLVLSQELIRLVASIDGTFARGRSRRRGWSRLVVLRLDDILLAHWARAHGCKLRALEEPVAAVFVLANEPWHQNPRFSSTASRTSLMYCLRRRSRSSGGSCSAAAPRATHAARSAPRLRAVRRKATCSSITVVPNANCRGRTVCHSPPLSSSKEMSVCRKSSARRSLGNRSGSTRLLRTRTTSSVGHPTLCARSEAS